MNALYRRRVFVNRFNLAVSLLTMAFGMGFLLWILFVLFQRGVAAFSPVLFTQSTPPPGSAGGLANAIVGSLMVVGFATLISTPVGILAGIYLAEYGKKRLIASLTRFMNDILLSAPSIVLGLFIYTVYVAPLFTALNNQFFSADMNGPIANLPVVIFQFAMSPFDEWQQLAWAASLLITLTVLLINIVARTLTRRKA